MHDAKAKSHRRWLQFSLCTLLIVVTLVVGGLAALRAYLEPYRRQGDTMALIRDLGGRYDATRSDKWLRWLYGADMQNIVLVDVANYDEPSAYLPSIASLPYLETLVVGGQRFGDEQLRRLADLDALRSLVLDSTSVTDDGIASIKRALPQLVVFRSQRRAIAAIRNLDADVATEMSTAHPNIRQLVGDEYFSDVEFVHLREAKVGDECMVHLAAMTNLEMLNLRDTLVTDAGLAKLKRLANLHGLELQRTLISDAGLRHLRSMPKLELLGLSQTNITDDGLVHLNGMTRLTWLDLSGTKVTDAGLPHLEGLTNLKNLQLESTQISDASLVGLNAIAKLETLNLSATKITDDGLVHLIALTQLKRVFVYDSLQLTDAALVHLQKITTLEFLNVRGTRITADGVRQFRSILPHCEIRQ